MKRLCQYSIMALLFIGYWSLAFDRTIVAQPDQGLHSMGVYAYAPSPIRIIVDNKLVYKGILPPGRWREWDGRRFTLEIGYASDLALQLDGHFSGRLGRLSKGTTVHWPADIASTNITPTILAVANITSTNITSTNITSTNITSTNITSTNVTSTNATTNTVTAPSYYLVQPGDTLFVIAQQFNIDMDILLKANNIRDANVIEVGMALAIPGSDGALPDPALLPTAAPITNTATVTVPNRGTIVERMTTAAQKTTSDSPFYKTTWLTYYGRPNTPIMGILGEYDLDPLTELLKQAATVYDQANGNELGVMPAFHLVYGMATKAPGDDNSHLAFLTDEVVKAYIDRAEKEKFSVILDIQIGALTPAESIKAGLPWLKYKNVHLAIDPEFAMAHKNQAWPGDPIGFITAQQVNEVQAVMQQYMTENKIEGTRILLVHQFQDDMIVDKDKLDENYNQIALTISADGWGGPWGKIVKYNAFVDRTTKFGAFKLFYKWDEPLLTEREALGVDPYAGSAYIEVTPNLIMYQ